MGLNSLEELFDDSMTLCHLEIESEKLASNNNWINKIIARWESPNFKEVFHWLLTMERILKMTLSRVTHADKEKHENNFWSFFKNVNNISEICNLSMMKSFHTDV